LLKLLFADCPFESMCETPGPFVQRLASQHCFCPYTYHINF